MDLLAYMARSLMAARPGLGLALLLPGPPPVRSGLSWGKIRRAIKAALGRPKLGQNPEEVRLQRAAELIERLRAICPSLEIRYGAGLDETLAEAAAELRLDAICLAMRAPRRRPACALVGYVPDYQHRHLPHLFSDAERAERDDVFDRLIAVCDAMVMNAHAVAEDMRRFSCVTPPALHVLPFSPNLDPAWLTDEPHRSAAYALGRPYFIVCNQFWVHKDHRTAFRAFAVLARRHPEVSMVCTGGTSDYRDPGYFSRLQAEVAELGLRSRLRFLGHIPKRDQIELLKGAVAVVQPTLFEGGPGGGSTYEAVALGQRVLLSDLPVNREANEGDIRFFPPGDHEALAGLMETALAEDAARVDPAELRARSDERLRRNGEAAWAATMTAITKRRGG
jgi:glycosyltransferase involved in cell wall biosynthesis